MFDPKMDLSESEKKWADERLSNWNDLNKDLPDASLKSVRILLAHEVQTRKRLSVAQRLCARLGRLEQRENEQAVAKALSR